MLKQLTQKGVQMLLVKPSNMRVMQAAQIEKLVNTPSVSIGNQIYLIINIYIERFRSKEKKKKICFRISI